MRISLKNKGPTVMTLEERLLERPPFELRHLQSYACDYKRLERNPIEPILNLQEHLRSPFLRSQAFGCSKKQDVSLTTEDERQRGGGGRPRVDYGERTSD